MWLIFKQLNLDPNLPTPNTLYTSMNRDTRQFPWVDIICPCHEDNDLSFKNEATLNPLGSVPGSEKSPEGSATTNDDKPHDKPDKSVIPKALWDPFSRHKLDYLYFCEHCQTIKCPRCIDEEVVCRYCPTCLFEVTPATARSEGNRCPRNCFQCPKCATSINPRPVTGAAAAAVAASLGRASSRVGARQLHGDTQTSRAQTNSYKLSCTFCDWDFDQCELVREDMDNDTPLVFQRGRSLMQQLQNVDGRTLNTLTKRFQDLQLFYFQRSLEEGTRAALVDDRIFGPSSNRDVGDEKDLKSMLTSRASQVRSFAEILEQRIQERNKQDTSAEIFREIDEVDEATNQRKAAQRSQNAVSKFLEYQDMMAKLTEDKSWQENEDGETEIEIEMDEDEDIQIPCMLDLSETSLPTKNKPVVRDQVDVDQLLPVPQPLRSKYSKKCAACRHTLVKPDPKPSSVRFKVKLMANNYLPHLRLSEFPPKSGYPAEFVPGKVYTLLLTITNPMHVGVKVSLATLSRPSLVKSEKESLLTVLETGTENKSMLSGNYPHKITIITPTVDLGPDEELWDEASLIRGVPSMFIKRESTLSKRIEVEGGRRSAKNMGYGQTNTGDTKNGKSLGAGVYQQDKNWSSIAIEVVPSSKSKLLEIPLFVNFSFEVPVKEGKSGKKDTEKKKRRDLDPDQPDPLEEKDQSSLPKPSETVVFGYWAVLGVGPIGTSI